MCQLFTNSDPAVWKSKSRSIRVDGVVTSVRLETFFWETLEEIGFRDSMSVGQLITKLYREAREAEHDLSNFTSYLRVCCGRYLSLTADQEILRGDETPIAELPAYEIMSAEKKRRSERARAHKLSWQQVRTLTNGRFKSDVPILSED